MRNHGFRLFAIVSMLALLFGAQLCMLVQCSPTRATGVAHGCCENSTAKRLPGAPAQHESAKPCCIPATLASAPALEPPAAADSPLLAAMVIAPQLAAAPVAVSTASPPGDADTPLPSPLITAAGSRAPPLA